MARLQRLVIGIELQERHIRIVEVTDSARPTVVSVGETAMPEGAIRNGAILRHEAVASAIRRLMQLMDVRSQDAIFGVPGSSCILRTLTIPPVPDVELPSIVDGEIKHFHIFTTHDAVYNYFPVGSGRKGEGGRAQNVIMIGSEGPTITGLREVAEKAFLNVLAFEPVHVGMYRTAHESLCEPSSMIVTVSETRTSVVLHSKGEICLFREIDLGTDSLVLRHFDDDPFANPALLEAEETPLLDPKRVNIENANSLAIELKRSVEYFQREFPTSEPIDSVVVVTTEPALADLTPWLSSELNLSVDIVGPSKFTTEKESVRSDFKGLTGSRFAPAYGLAMRGVYAPDKRIPLMDLFSRERTAVELETKRKGVAGSLLISIAAIAAGLFFAYKFGIDANHAQHALDHVTEDIGELQSTFQRSADQQELARKQYDLLIQDGVPVSRLIDTVAARVTGPIGINDIQANNTGTISFSGEAVNESTAIRVADDLKTAPLILSANVTSFEKIDPEGSRPGVKFRIASTGRFGKPAKPAGANP